MVQVYTLFDRRCRTQTALDTLAKLRRRLQRFPQLGEALKKRFSPTLEKALTFLDDKLRDSSEDTGLIQPVHDGVIRGFVDALRLGLHATCPAPGAH